MDWLIAGCVTVAFCGRCRESTLSLWKTGWRARKEDLCPLRTYQPPSRRTIIRSRTVTRYGWWLGQDWATGAPAQRTCENPCCSQSAGGRCNSSQLRIAWPHRTVRRGPHEPLFAVGSWDSSTWTGFVQARRHSGEVYIVAIVTCPSKRRGRASYRVLISEELQSLKTTGEKRLLAKSSDIRRSLFVYKSISLAVRMLIIKWLKEWNTTTRCIWEVGLSIFCVPTSFTERSEAQDTT